MSLEQKVRTYRGCSSPLEFYRTHPELPNFRGELSTVDPGLYRALLRHNQIDQAVPQYKKILVAN